MSELSQSIVARMMSSRRAVATDSSVPTAQTRSSCEPHRGWIEAQVRLDRNTTPIYEELVDRFGFTQRGSATISTALGSR